jgi:zinc protease
MEDERDLDDFTDFENKTKALTIEEVNTALKKYFDRSKLVMVYAGDFNKK